MKYKICEYVDGEGTHVWQVKYKHNWIPYWFTDYDHYSGSPHEYKTKQDAIGYIEYQKLRTLQAQRTKVTCEYL